MVNVIRRHYGTSCAGPWVSGHLDKAGNDHESAKARRLVRPARFPVRQADDSFQGIVRRFVPATKRCGKDRDAPSTFRYEVNRSARATRAQRSPDNAEGRFSFGPPPHFGNEAFPNARPETRRRPLPLLPQVFPKGLPSSLAAVPTLRMDRRSAPCRIHPRVPSRVTTFASFNLSGRRARKRAPSRVCENVLRAVPRPGKWVTKAPKSSNRADLASHTL